MGTVFYLGQAMPSGNGRPRWPQLAEMLIAADVRLRPRTGAWCWRPKVNRRPRKGRSKGSVAPIGDPFSPSCGAKARRRRMRRITHPGVFCFVGARGSTRAPSTGSAGVARRIGRLLERRVHQHGAHTSSSSVITMAHRNSERTRNGQVCTLSSPGPVAFLIGTSTRLPATAAQRGPCLRRRHRVSSPLPRAPPIAAPTRERQAPARARERTAASRTRPPGMKKERTIRTAETLAYFSSDGIACSEGGAGEAVAPDAPEVHPPGRGSSRAGMKMQWRM